MLTSPKHNVKLNELLALGILPWLTHGYSSFILANTNGDGIVKFRFEIKT